MTIRRPFHFRAFPTGYLFDIVGLQQWSKGLTHFSRFAREMNTAINEELAMPRSLCLTRQCLGLVTRIECVVRPLSGDKGMWTLLFAAGMSGEQPSALKAQGPFHGPIAAESVLDAIAESLVLHGYQTAQEIPIWSVHLQGELRRVNSDAALNQRTSPAN
jgi:hypothetical protein